MRYNQAMEEYGTLADATTDAGYCSKSTLKTAALRGALKIIEAALTSHMTTRAWVAECREGRRAGTYRRGQPRTAQDGGEGLDRRALTE